MGIRFAASTRTVVEIVRRRGMNVVITPQDRDGFLSHAREALEAHRRLEKGPGA